MKYMFNFNPMVNDSVRATVTSHSGKSVEYFMSGSNMMAESAKPSVKSIKVTERYVAGLPSADAFNMYYLKKNKKSK